MAFIKMLKDWELEKGVEIKERRKDKLISEKEYKRKIKSNYIVVKTHKGLEYLESLNEKR